MTAHRTISRTLMTGALLLLLPGQATAKKYADLTPLYGQLAKNMGKRGTLYAVTYVALCSNKLIVCGNKKLGNGGSLRENLYWGTTGGLARQLSRHSPWVHRGSVVNAKGPLRAVAVHSRAITPTGLWKKAKGRKGRLIHITVAYHGDNIADATRAFAHTAAHGTLSPDVVALLTKQKKPPIVVTAVTPFPLTGYIGHNYLMDKPSLLKKLPSGRTAKSPRGVWVTACRSHSWFHKFLSRAGATPLVMTKTLMYPGGFLTRALLDGIATGRTQRQIVALVSAAYYKNQKSNGTTRSGARSVFWP